MTNFAYNVGIPAATNNPSTDQPNMLTNTNSTAAIIAQDHISFNLNNGGYHKNIHQPDASNGGSLIGGQSAWNPVIGSGGRVAVTGAAIPGVQQTFVLDYTPAFAGAPTNTQLFSLSGTGDISQLTGAFASTDGWQWTGGILVQWGIVTTSASGSFSSGAASGNVTFTSRTNCIPFPNSCFIVIATPFWNTAGTAPNGAGSVNVNQTSVSSTGFSWQFNSNSSKYTGFYWYALGR